MFSCESEIASFQISSTDPLISLKKTLYYAESISALTGFSHVFGVYFESIEIAWRYQSYIQLEINP